MQNQAISIVGRRPLNRMDAASMVVVLLVVESLERGSFLAAKVFEPFKVDVVGRDREGLSPLSLAAELRGNARAWMLPRWPAMTVAHRSAPDRSAAL